MILQYIADHKPGALAPAYGTLERYRVMEWLNFIAHRNPQAVRTALVSGHARRDEGEAARRRSPSASTYVAKTLSTQPYLTGDTFAIADAYLFTVVNWAAMLKIDLSPWPALQQFQARVAARPQVHATLVAEGLAKPVAVAA